MQLIEKLQQGQDGALISDAGTPLISDPGYSLVGAAHAAGITVVPIPGPCALVTALSVSGLPTDKFLFEGFLSAKSGSRRKRLTELAQFPHTLVFYEAPHRILSLVQDVQEIFGPERRAFIARELTKKFESLYLYPLQEMHARLEKGEIPQKGEFVLIIEGWHHPLDALLEGEEEKKIHHLLTVLSCAEVPLKQAVQIAIQLTGLPKK